MKMMVRGGRLVGICPLCRRPEKILTRRQVEVVRTLVAHPEASNAALARRLAISPYTIKRHLWEIYRRLGVSSRLECMAVCLTLGVVTLDDVGGPVH